MEQVLRQLGRQFPPVKQDEWIHGEHAAFIRVLHPKGHVDFIQMHDRPIRPSQAHRQGPIGRDGRERRLEPLTGSFDFDVERQFQAYVRLRDPDRAEVRRGV